MNAISNIEYKRPTWNNILTMTLGFWLSASLLLDCVIMPSLYLSGMMSQDNFTSAGYTIFWSFNRLELLCASLILTSIMVVSNNLLKSNRIIAVLGILLLSIAFVDTYFLTPQMSAIGIHLNLFEGATQVPATMNLLHGSYWVLEVIKLVAAGTILKWSLQR